MAGGLATVGQDDFAAGAIRSVARHLISSRGLYTVVNGLYTDDGSISRRGGSEYQSNAAFGASERWIWDGLFACGQRTVFASPAAFGVLAADDATPVNLGGGGLSEPKSSAFVGGILFIGGGTMYAGSRKAADYSTGTITVTKGSKVVTGAGTSWLANVDPGMLLRVAGAGRYYVVATVDSDTQVTLTDVIEAAAAGVAYALTRLGTVANHGGPTAEIYATVAQRLVACSGNTVLFSEGVNPGNVDAALVGNFQTHTWPLPTNQHVLSEGVQVVAAAGLRDRLLVFTTAGLWQLSNMALRIVDGVGTIQQRLEFVSADVVAWGAPGIAHHANGLVVPTTDGVYLLDGVSEPIRLSQTVTPKIATYVRQGYKPGGADVYRSHFFLPVLDAGNSVVDFMVCRLDRQVRTSLGDVFPWSWFDGHGANVTAVAARAQAGASRSPNLLGAGRSSDARILKLGAYFEPTAVVKNDADGTTHRLVIETRDYATGKERNRNLVRFAKLTYELVAAPGDTPKVIGYVSKGGLASSVSLWGAMVWGSGTWTDSALAEYILLAFGAPPADIRSPFVWGPEQGMGLSTEYVRYRFESSGPCASLVFRAVESLIRPSNKVF